MKMVPASFSNEKFQVYKKYQMHVHGDAPEVSFEVAEHYVKYQLSKAYYLNHLLKCRK